MSTEHQGWGLLSQFSPFRYFPYFPLLSKQTLAIEYHVYIWQVLPQLSCGDTCQIWMWFRESNRYFCNIEYFAYGEISERSFSNPHPRPVLRNHARIYGWQRTPSLTIYYTYTYIYVIHMHVDKTSIGMQYNSKNTYTHVWVSTLNTIWIYIHQLHKTRHANRQDTIVHTVVFGIRWLQNGLDKVVPIIIIMVINVLGKL